MVNKVRSLGAGVLLVFGCAHTFLAQSALLSPPAPKRSGSDAAGVVNCVVVNGSYARPASGIKVYLVGNKMNRVKISAANGAVEFDKVPFGTHYKLLVYDNQGRLTATEAEFTLSSQNPLHTCAPDLDISHSIRSR